MELGGAERGVIEYLAERAHAGDLSGETVGEIEGVWTQLKADADFKVPIPDVGVGPDGQVLLTWDRGPYHLEAEFPDGGYPADLFFAHRMEGWNWGEAYHTQEFLVRDLLDKLEIYFKPKPRGAKK